MNKKTLILIVVGVVLLSFAGFKLFNTKYSNKRDMANVNADNYSIRYEFPEKPKVGNYILKVNIFKNNKLINDVEVIVSYDMPSMRGHHAKSEPMKKNTKGDFLIPIHFAMRGNWEIILSVQENRKEVLLKVISLDI